MLRHSFSDWDREPLTTRITSKMHRGVPLKERVDEAIFRLRVQENRLDAAANRMQQHDKEMFNKCVRAQMDHDTARASMYANECAQVRKMAKVTLQCQLALEQAALRLETVREFGQVAIMMAPVAAVVRSVQGQITGVIPEVAFELGEIGEMLNSVVCEVGEATGSSYEVQTSSEEAQRILTEANTLAEHRMQQRFPDLPTAPPPIPQKGAEQGFQ
jgi:division protein CdvB (Snf7/Vps24/ESCRT-III family)